MQVKNHFLFDDKGVQVPYKPSPNHSGTLKPKYLLIHYTADTNPQATINWFLNKASQVSAHLLIDREGNITQFVRFDQKAWHAGDSHWNGVTGLNSYSIGIELTNAGWTSLPKDGYIHATHKYPSSTPKYWQPYTCKQLDALNKVAIALREYYNLEETMGHDDVSPGRKTDPGPAFDMDAFKAATGFDNNKEWYITTSDLNLRSGASITATKVSVLPKGTKVEQLDVDGIWYKVFVQGSKLTGWASSAYLKKV